MKTKDKHEITVSTTVKLTAEEAWQYWTKPEHITNWNFASDDWKCPKAENDLKPGGRLVWRMEAKDGSVGFDFSGVYEEVKPYQRIVYKMDDERRATIDFIQSGNETTVIETFEAEPSHSLEQQQTGWQAILNNFKTYAEKKR